MQTDLLMCGPDFEKALLLPEQLIQFLLKAWWTVSCSTDAKGSKCRNISEKAIYQRKRKNVITFGGQFACFIAEILFSVILQMLTVYHGSNAGNGLVPPLAISGSAILAMTFIIASPEIRRFYFN